jgi:hypothetical protein
MREMVCNKCGLAILAGKGVRDKTACIRGSCDGVFESTGKTNPEDSRVCNE